MAELVRGPIDVAALLAAAARPDCGGIAVFLGTTRAEEGGRTVARLEYEAYERMALDALARLEREALARFAVARCALVHRLGEVPAAEASVAVVVSAAHRAPALEACRWLIDELKRRAPIWKKEHFAGGGEAWVPGAPLRDD